LPLLGARTTVSAVKRRWQIAWTVAVPVVVAAGWVASFKLSPRSTPSSQPALVVLDAGALADFKHAFNEARGKTRVLALLSPT
jgi:hypothetical protein